MARSEPGTVFEKIVTGIEDKGGYYEVHWRCTSGAGDAPILPASQKLEVNRGFYIDKREVLNPEVILNPVGKDIAIQEDPTGWSFGHGSVVNGTLGLRHGVKGVVAVRWMYP
jgi:hypothetical protein